MEMVLANNFEEIQEEQLVEIEGGIAPILAGIWAGAKITAAVLGGAAALYYAGYEVGQALASVYKK